MFSGRRNISVDVAFNGRILDTGNIDPDIFFAIFPEFRLPGSERYNFIRAARLFRAWIKIYESPSRTYIILYYKLITAI